MREGSQPAGKVCALCATDVAAQPRVKDKQGRYFCQPCFDKVRQKRAAAKSASVTAPAAESAGFAIDEPDLGSVREESTVPIGFRQQELCPQCEHPVTESARICVNCGYDRVSRRAAASTVVQTAADPEPMPGAVAKNGKCGKCGYDLSKIITMRCPECGTVNRLSSKKDQYDEDSRRAARIAYVKPAVITVVGLVAAAAILYARDSSPGFLIANAVLYAVMYVIGLIIYFFCTITFVGVDEPFHLMALRLLAVFSITNIVSALTDPLPTMMGRFGLVGMVHAISLMTIMEIDYEDAWIVAALTFFARTAVLIAFIVLMTR